MPVGDAVKTCQRLFCVRCRIQGVYGIQMVFLEKACNGVDIDLVLVFLQQLEVLVGLPALFLIGRLIAGQVGPDGLVVQVSGIGFLYVGRIQKKVFTGVCCGPVAHNPSGETVLGQHRNPAGVIDMGVGKHHIGDHLRSHLQGPVFLGRFLAPPLEHAAVQHDAIVVYSQHVHRSRYFPYRTQKGNIHLLLLCLVKLKPQRHKGHKVSSFLSSWFSCNQY